LRLVWAQLTRELKIFGFLCTHPQNNHAQNQPHPQTFVNSQIQLNALPFFQNIKNALTAGGTGGLTWHLHAALSSQRWESTKARIETHLFKGLKLRAQLDKHSAGELKLVLIGASAGWMMSTPWLESFKEIVIYDIDPLTPVLFRLNHGRALKQKGVHLRFHTTDAIDQLDRILSKHPDSVIWFDNVLGQHRIRLKNSDLASTQLKILQRRLKGRFWGSVHDLYSGPVQRVPDSPVDALLELARIDGSDQDSARVRITRDENRPIDQEETSLGQARQRFLQKLGATAKGGAWLDHETAKVFPPGTALTWTGWDFKRDYCHCLELGWTSSN